MLGWMSRSQGKSSRSTAVVMSGLDEIFRPEAARAREIIAGDQPWEDGTIVIDLPERRDR